MLGKIMSDEGSTDDENLRVLLSTHAPIDDWKLIYQRVKCFPEEARQRYYRNESPLQLALKLREMKRTDKSDSQSRINRIQVLQLIIDADPSSLTSRDDEGRTVLHTACSAGRSWEILQLLVEAEESFRQLKEEEGGKIKEQEFVEQRSAMLRTDQPGGNLPLHLVAACPCFDESSVQDNSSFFPYASFDEGSIQCSVSQSIISAYYATTTVREAYPQSIWERDCEGEIPLHAAASWGNVGSVLSLLMGATLLSVGDRCDGAKDAAQTLDNSNKTPLDRACERVCAMCVHDKPFHVRRNNFRVSVTRDDPFMASATTRDRPMNRNIRLSVNQTQSRRRIPGVGSSFRSSFSSSSVDPTEITMLRDSFISSRQPVDPSLGLKPLCTDGLEEFAKVEMLARAALGQFNDGSDRSINICPSLLHAVIELGCPPELVWHSAAKNPHEVEKLDEPGKSPLFVAVEKVSNLMRLCRERTPASDCIPQEAAADSDESEPSEAADRNSESSQLEGETSKVTEEATQDKVNADTLMYQEIIDMLIKSRVFGIPAMASIPDNRGRLPIHLVLEAGGLWTSGNEHQGDDDSNSTDTAHQDPHIIDTLIDANPQSLLIRDKETGLFPFMIAATSSTEGVNESTKELETIFRLLIESAEVISYCII